MSIAILLDRPSHAFQPGEILKGAVLVTCSTTISHHGLTLQAEGSVALQLSPRKVGLFEAFHPGAKPLQLLDLTIPLAPPGTLSSGKTTFPFEFPVRPASPHGTLFETYHGVFVDVQYFLTAEVQRGAWAKGLRETLQFVVINPGQAAPPPDAPPRAVRFTLEPQNLRNVPGHVLQAVPQFRFDGWVDSVVCDIRQPFTGGLQLHHSDTRVSRVELQLVRVEFCATPNGVTKEATEIQNIQLVDGDLCPGFNVPMFMVFPRLFTCPTLIASSFKVEFEVNLVIIFEDRHQLVDNFPVQLYRPLAAEGAEEERPA